MRRLAFNVQRDLAFHRTTVEFRNAVESMLERHGRLPDSEHIFHGFGAGPTRRRGGGRGPDDGRDDDRTGSGVPRRPRDGSGGAAIAREPPIPAPATPTD